MHSERARWIRRTSVWVTILTLFALMMASVFGGGHGSKMQSLSGTWKATVEGMDPGTRIELDLPGLFSMQGVPTDSRVRAEVEVELAHPEQLHGLYIELPLYAVDVLWDGVSIGHSGDPGAEGPQARRAASLLVGIPPSTSKTHHLTLDMKGDYNKGGILGKIVMGPLAEVQWVAVQQEGLLLAITLAMALVGVLHLVVASRDAYKPDHLFFGLTCTVLAFYTWSHADMSWEMLQADIPRLRLRRVMTSMLGPLPLLFTAGFVFRRIPQWAWVPLGPGVLFAVFSLTFPAEWLLQLEVASDALIVMSILSVMGLLLYALLHRIQGATLLAFLTTLPLVWGVGSEMSGSYGLSTGSSVLPLSLAFVIAGASAALSVKTARESERYRQFVSHSVDAMLTVDAAGQLLDTNRAGIDLLRGAGRVNNLLQRVASDDQPLVRAHLARAIKHPDRAEFRMQGGAGELVIESAATPIDSDTLLLLLRDVSRRRMLDRGLIQAARMETVAVLVGGIAHDFNNMLGTLLAHVGFLQALIAKPKIAARLDKMEATIERASLLTRRLLAVAGGTNSDLSPIELSTVCHNALELVQPSMGAGITVQVDLPETLPPVLGNAADLEHVLVNLLVNARDAVGNPGRITVSAEPFKLDNGARGVVISVQDDGPGVPEPLREQIFAPFFSTKGPDKGTGLGLAVAAQILRDHHGRIWLDSGPGARFCLALRHADTVALAPAPLPDGRQVLLVEDEEVLLELYGDALRAEGYEVTACSGGVPAWAALQESQPDILVTDVVMPGVTGLELASLCLDLYPEIPVLLVSGFIPDGDVPQIHDGTWHRLDKPVRAARLVSTVGHLCRRSERARRGELDITEVTYPFPPLDELSR